MLDAKNSQHELSIERFLVKSEEAFFGKVRRDKLSSAASIRSSQRDSIWGTPSPSIYTRPDCTFPTLASNFLTLTSLISAKYSRIFHHGL